MDNNHHPNNTGKTMQFGDYIIYVDESGDHNLTNINPNYPMFVLAFCIFNKNTYSQIIVPNLQNLKFRYFGHDMVVLHEREILKNEGHFKHFNKEQQNQFLSDISHIIRNSDFAIVACAIDKSKLNTKDNNPYDLALDYGLKIVCEFLKEKEQQHKLTHLIFECRGKNEDQDLLTTFEHIKNNYDCPLSIEMAHKRTNSAGLQFADLIARPIGNAVLRPTQTNQAMDIIRTKFYQNPTHSGLLILP